MNILFIKKHMDRSELELIFFLKDSGVNVWAMTEAQSIGVDEMKLQGIYIQPRPYRSKIAPSFICQIRRVIKKHSIQLIHATDSSSLSNAIWASYLLPVKIIGYRGTLARVRRLDPSYWLALLHPRVDKVICVNQSIYNYMRSFFPDEKLLLNYKGYDLSWGEEVARLDVDLPPMPERAFVVCYIANTRRRPYKGLEHLVKAMELVEETDVHLLFIGDYDEEVKILADQGAAASRIHFLGKHPHAASYLKYSDVFVLPSTRDGLPRSTKEAMAQGVAVITTNIEGPAELVIDGESGIHVKPGDPAAIANAIKTLYHQPALRRRLGAAGRQRLETHFSSTTFMQKTLNLYHELLNSK